MSSKIYTFSLFGEEIEYIVNRGKRKRIYLQVADGKLEIKVPLKTSDAEIQIIIANKLRWIYNNIKKYPKKERIKLNYDTGDIFFILGKKYTLNVIYEDLKKDFIEIDEEKNALKVYLKNKYLKDNDFTEEKRKTKVNKLINNYYEMLADTEVKCSMEKLMKKTGFIPASFKTRNFKRAWGNCSNKRVISINRECVKYSRHAIDYICLHELCHLKQMNHSKKFWGLVSLYMPDYKLAEKELKENRVIYI